MMHPATWELPSFPHEPVDEPELVDVADAYLTRLRKGRLRTLTRPDRWLTGAVHTAEGRLVPVSQKLGGLGGNQLVAADPTRVPTRPRARRLEGTWLYGGHWIHHFGHFVTETLTTLWPTGLTVDGVVFHAYGRHHGLEPWEEELFALTRYRGLPVEVVANEPLRVERLLVPSRSVVANGWAHDGAREVWDDLVAAVVPPATATSERIFVSRRGFNRRESEAGRAVRTSPERDATLERIFLDAGFTVVEPETLTVPDQIRLGAGADVLAGSAGTALHLSAFSPASTRVLEIGDERSPDTQVPHQRVIDRIRGHRSAFVPLGVELDALPDILTDLGISGSP